MDIKEFFKNLFNYNAKDTFKGLLKKKKQPMEIAQKPTTGLLD